MKSKKLKSMTFLSISEKMVKKQIFLSIATLFIFLFIFASVSASNGKNLSAQKFTDQIPTYLGWQSTNMSDSIPDYQNITWYGSFVYSSLRDQTANSLNFRMNKIMYGMIRTYFDDPSGVYLGNLTVLNSGFIAGDHLARNHNDSNNLDWGDYANRGFICQDMAKSYGVLDNKKLLRDDSIILDLGHTGDFGLNYSDFNYLLANESLTVWYKLDVNTSYPTTNTTADYSGYARTGTFISFDANPHTTSGIIDGAFNFDGVNDYIDMTHGTTADIRTVSLWAKFTNSTKAQGVSASANTRQSISLNTGRILQGQCTNRDNNQTRRFFSGADITDGWNFIVMDCDNEKFYINGVLSTGANAVTIGLSSNEANYRVGRTSGTLYLNGTIDDFKFYNRTVSASEVAYEYDKSINRLVGQAYISNSSRWGTNTQSGGVNYRVLINNTSDIATFNIINNTNYSINPYDVGNDSAIDVDLNVTIRFNDTLTNLDGFRISILNTSGNYNLINRPAGGNTSTWVTSSVIVPYNNSVKNPVQILLETNSTPEANITIDYIKLSFTRKTDWITSLNKTFSNVPYTHKAYVSNQDVHRALCDFEIWKVNNDTTHLTNFNLTLMNIVKKPSRATNVGINQTTNGIFREWNEILMRDKGCTTGASMTSPHGCFLNGYAGYDATYQYVSMDALGMLYNQSLLPSDARTLIFNALNDSSFVVSNLIIPNSDSSKQVSFGNRALQTTNPTTSTDIDPYNYLAFMAMYGANSYVDRWNYRLTQVITNLSYGGHSDLYEGGQVSKFWDLYDLWQDQNTNSPLPIESAGSFLNNFSEAGLATIKVNDTIYYLSYGGATPSGGIISDIYRNNSQQHLYSGEGQSRENDNKGYGLGLLFTNTNCSNAWDSSPTFTLINSTYPYKIQFNGTLTYSNTTTCGVTYTTQYTFYDTYLEVNQTTSSSVNMELWQVSSQTIGTGSLSALQPNTNYKKNNNTIIPLDFNINFNDSSNGASWGTVDKFNSSGSSFRYLVQISDNTPVNVSGDNIYIKNIESRSLQIPINNLTDSILFFSNGTVCGSSTISSNDGSINCTVASNQNLTVLDKINLTENSARADSPFWISSRTDNGKAVTYHLASNLSDTVSGLKFYPLNTIKCGSATYTSNSGAVQGSPQLFCTGGLVDYVLVNDYEPANGSNTLVITYGVGGDAGGGGSNVGGESGSNSSTGSFYNRTFLCGEAEKFIEFYTKDDVFNYTTAEYNAFKNKIVLLQGFGIEDSVLKPFVNDFAGQCPDFIEEDGTPTNTGGQTEEEFNYLYLWIGLFVFVVLIVIILIVMGGNAHKDRTVLMAGLFQKNKYDPSNP